MAAEIKIPICLIEKIEFENEDDQFNLLGAKNNDGLSEKWVIVFFYTLKNKNAAVSNKKTISAYAWVHLLF